MDQNHRFFRNLDCEYFPCHSGADKEYFNCMFCYCPLYVLDSKCGGQFTYTSGGIKDCSNCLIPHQPEGFDRVLEHWPEIVKLMEERRNTSAF